MFLKSNRLVTILIILMFLVVGAMAVAAKPSDAGKNSNMGIARHPDIVKDEDGVMHMVWQEPMGDQYEIFYASQGQGGKKEVGIGSDMNTVHRVSYTPRDSVWPQITIDPETGIMYILWTESVPTTLLDGYGGEDEPAPILTPTLYMVAAEFDSGNTESLSFSDYQNPWTSPQNFASAESKVTDFKIVDSEYLLKSAGEEVKRGIIDTDDDKIKDSDEYLGKLGYKTSWRNPDTDGDKIIDSIEYEIGFSPLINEYYTPYVKEYLKWILWFSDTDGDGLTYIEETGTDYPVTMGVAKMLHTGEATYRFFPKDDHEAYLRLGLQLERVGIFTIPPPASAYFRLIVTVDTESEADQVVTYSDYHMEWERFFVDVGPFDVYEDEVTDVTVEIDFTSSTATSKQQISNDIEEQQQYYIKTLELRSLMLADTDDSQQFNYKEGRDFIPDSEELTGIQIKDFTIKGDPNRPDLFIEVDWFAGHEPTPEVWSESINAFSDAGIKFHYKIDDKNLPLNTAMTLDDDSDGVETLRNDDELQEVLDLTRNSLYDEYIHFVCAHYIEIDALPGWTIYGGAQSGPTATDLTESGVVFADEAMQDIANTFSNLMERRLKVVVHEIGHCLGAAHEKNSADGGDYDPRVDGGDGVDDFNDYNVMRQDAIHNADAAELLRGNGNADNRVLGATELIGRPRFSIESVEQFDMTDKLSVDTGRNIDILDQYV
jgi:hypothetical protein